MEQYQAFIFPVLLIAIFYFLLIRPQNKSRKQRNAMIASLSKGDKVVTIGGLHGTIVDLNDQTITIKVNDNTRLVFERAAINEKKTVGAEVTATTTEEEK
ncbi:preprotein translocase subunit YajC [Thermoactinomyces sp. DSM 45892]|uniref:preprotein translocase subunit YajC n=1 Tax=Thermoactinomyces sp. DSM 45892 TaxID=1882753 RepID=UPI00089BBE86|nr:preprotein translocase subunit YajC [Thermoactinomyces sp. DSM 45892]SDY03486.1 preprotein translocase subunit YajC [Thermoactinomyces sp. DSM 45892]